MNFKEVEHAISQIKAGKIIILLDDSNRENEGDFVQASECVSPESVNFMITHGRGLLCQTITETRARQLCLEPQVNNNTSLHTTKFTVSTDVIHNTTTGVSAFDRAATILAISNDATKPEDLARPGHIFPIVAHPQGLLERRGHTEGSIMLAELAGFKPNAIICEILNENGAMANYSTLNQIAKKFNLAIIHIKDLVLYIQGVYK